MEKMESCTDQQFDAVTAKCREVFSSKLKDYGASWRILRPTSLTDQIYIKAKRIRSIEVKGENMVGEGVHSEFMGIVNYGVVGLIQLQYGYVDRVDMSKEQALSLYDEKIAQAKNLMFAKNHDYGEAWRDMRVFSFTDIILTKINRTKEIEDNNGKTLVSEGIDANYLDMINYAIFALIRLDFDEK